MPAAAASPTEPQVNIQQFVLGYFAERPGITAGYVMAMLAYPIGVVVLPALIGTVLDRLKTQPFAQWAYLVYLLIGLAIVRLIAHVAWFYLDTYLVTDLQSYMRRKVFTDVIRAYAYNFQTLRVSSVLSKSLKLPVAAFDLVKEWHHVVIPAGITLLSLIVYMFTIDWVLAAMVIAFAALAVGVLYASWEVCVRCIIGADFDHDAIHDNIGDVFDNLLQVYLSNAAKEEVDRLDAMHSKHLDQMTDARNCTNHFVTLVKVAIMLLAAAAAYVMWIRYHDPASGFKDEQLTALAFVVVATGHVFFNTFDAWSRLLYDTALVDKLQDYLNRLLRRVVPRPTDPEPPAAASPVPVAFDAVSFWYPDRDRQILDRVSFAVPPRSLVRVSGPIGSGKSTIALLALGLYQFEGTITLFGNDVTAMSRAAISKLVGFIPQGAKLLDRTLYDNLRSGSALDRETAQAALDYYGIDFAGLDTPVGRGGTELSSGQRAMVALLREMLRDAPIIVCDEVTANLDKASAARVVALIKEAAKDRTVLVITHQTDLRLPFTHQLTLDGAGGAKFTT